MALPTTGLMSFLRASRRTLSIFASVSSKRCPHIRTWAYKTKSQIRGSRKPRNQLCSMLSAAQIDALANGLAGAWMHLNSHSHKHTCACRCCMLLAISCSCLASKPTSNDCAATMPSVSRVRSARRRARSISSYSHEWHTDNQCHNDALCQ
eukprot:COSAG01_NODE_6417_length_3677_cov_7.108720_3_plen_151_part_00